MATGSTVVQEVTIPASGEVDGRVDVTHAGTYHAVASVTIGTVLVRLKSRPAAEQIVETWQLAALHLDSIVEDANRDQLGPDLGVGPVGVVLAVESYVATRFDAIPVQAGRNYLRIRVGPVVWLVYDRAAYWSIRKLWEVAEQLIRR